MTCSTAITNCLTCNNTGGLYFENNKCVSTCSSQFYLLNDICTACQSPCKTCGATINTCTECFLNSIVPIFYSNTCINSSQCTTGHYVDTANSSC